MTDNFDKSTILDSFLDEVTAYLPEIEANLDRLQQSPGDTEALEETYRRAHTIGGSAAMMDFPALAHVAQGMEEILSEAMERGAPLTGATIALLRRSHGRLSRLVEHIRTGADDGPVVAEDDADRSAWRGTVPNTASGFEASGPGLRSQPGFNGGAPTPGAPGGIQTSPGLQAPEWMAAFAASNTNGQQHPQQQPPGDFADRPTGAPPAVIPGSSTPGTSLPGADIAELGTRAMQAMPAPPSAPSAPSVPSGSQSSYPGGSSFPSDPSRPSHPAQPSQPGWDISQPATMPIQSPFIAPSASASAPALSSSNAPVTQGGAEGSVVDEIYTDEEAVRRQVGQLRDVVAQLRQAAQTMDEERTELSSFLDGSQDALARLEVWAGQQMGLDLPSSPDGVRQYLPLSVIWVTTARLKRLVTLIHNSSRSLTVTQEQIDETLNELRDAIRGLGNISGAISTMGGSPDAGFSATVAQITWAPVGGGDQQALSPGARVEIERSVREELRRELEDDVRDEIAAEVRQGEEQRLRHELEIAIRRELLAELQPNLGSSAVTIQDGGVRVLSRLPFASENARRQRQVTSEQSPEAQEVFREEALEHLQTITRGIEELEQRPGDVEVIRSIRRAMHTLKGAAGMMGFRLIQELSHVSEDLLERLADGQMAFTPNVHSLILDTSEMLDQLVAGAIPADAQPAKARAIIERYSAMTGIPIPDDLFSSHPGARTGSVDLTELDDRPDVSPKPSSGDLSVRLQLSKLDDLVNLFGELLINRSVLEERIERLGQLVGETVQVSDRLRDIGGELETGFETTMLANGQGPIGRPGPGPANGMAMRAQVAGNGFGGNKGRMPAFGGEFDPIELDRYTDFHRLSRGLSEGVSDATSLSHEMETLIREAQTTFARENRLSSDFQDRLLKARLVPLQSLTPRLYRAVRGSALRARKEVEFFVEGVETEVDRKVFEEVEGPLLHLVRNAVNHGIESPEEREANGKQRAGRILVKAAYEGSQVIISVSDDGEGIDPEKVRAAAVARGLIDAYTPISEKEAIDFIFRPGYSTAESVTEESGRGVGLDVVNDVVTRLRGSVEVDTVLGQGTTFTMKFPISLQIARAVMVKIGDQTLAIPMAVVEQIGRLDYYRRVPGAVPAIEMRGERYPLAHLGNYLKVPVGVVDERSSVLLVNAGKHRIALLIDSIVNQQEIVSKPLGPHLRDVRGVAGATVLGNGQIVLILELHELLSQQPRGGFTLAEPGSSRRAESPEPPQRPAPAPQPHQPRQSHQPQVTSSHLPTEPLPPAPWDRASQGSAPGGPSSQHFTGSPSQPAQRAFVIPQRTTGHPVVAGQPHSYVLVVDDSPSVRRVVSGMLKNAGWAVQAARDGVEALEILGRERPAAVLLDIEMPRMDGYELIATIRSQDMYRNLPLIVLTSRAATKHKQRADQLGADAYLVKPYQDEQLINTLNSLINARG